MARILIAEEDRSLNDRMAANLRLAGHECDLCLTGGEALAMAAQRAYDLVLLDVMLSCTDGFPLAERLPAGLPVILVTDRAGLNEGAQGLGPGADDYLIKPFETSELLARVEAVLRRTRRSNTGFVFGDLRVDFTARRVFRAGREVALTPQEYALLEALVINRNLALSREKLLSIAWGYDYRGETRTVDVHVNRLRTKLGLADSIQTVYKVGYRFSTRP